MRTLRVSVAAWCLAASLLTPLPACSEKPPAGGLRADQEIAKLSVYNHTGDYIHQSYINGQGGGNAYAYTGGGSFVCCIVYPSKWHEGLTAKVRWTTSSSDPSATGRDAEGQWHEKVVPIDRYREPGTTLNIHFLPGGEVRLIVTSMTAGWPGYPGPAAPVKPAGYPPWEKK